MTDDKKKLYGQLIDFSKMSGGVMLRGLLPFYVLQILAEENMYGTQIIGRIYEMTQGHWKPSPGSIYPLLQKMENLRFISEQHDDEKKETKRVYRLTELGWDALTDLRREIVPRLKMTIEIFTLQLKQVESGK